MREGLQAKGEMDLLTKYFCSQLGNLALYTCLGCGSCSNLCPASGKEEMDPCRFIQLIVNGESELVLNTPWIWHCSGCGQCKASCPVGIDIPATIKMIRSMKEGRMLPEKVRHCLDAWISCGNLCKMYPLEYLGLLESGARLYREQTGKKDFRPPIDRHARVLLVVAPELLRQGPELLTSYIHLLESAKEDWTFSSMPLETADPFVVTGSRRLSGIWERRLLDVTEGLNIEIVIIDDCLNGAGPLGPFGMDEPKVGSARIVTASQLVTEYLSQERILMRKRPSISMTIQEPCHVAGEASSGAWYHLIKRLVSLEDMVEPRGNGSCCGGSLFRLGLYEEASSFFSTKAKELDESDKDAVVCPCATCFLTLKHLQKRGMIKKKVLFLPDVLSMCLG